MTTKATAADIPAVSRLLAWSPINTLVTDYGRTLITQQLRLFLDQLRQQALAGTLDAARLEASALMAAFTAHLQTALQPKLRSMINLTGTVLHTNLGRALLPDEAIEAVSLAMQYPSNVEFDVATGKRGDRDDLIEALVCELTGAEAATVVNNNAAAVMLMLSALAKDKEVVVSRGELVEIGGSFRIPDIMAQSGATLVEVGTTNRTHEHDYERAITEHTAMLMKVHCSNYKVMGFTKEVSVAQMVALAQQHGIPTTVDLGSGTLVDLAQWGLPHEPTVRQIIEAGADVVTFSGDKLLGGPQAGLIVGKKAYIEAIKKHPLKRALRVGKLVLAALESVLALYRQPEQLEQRLTTLRLFARIPEQMQAQAQQLQPLLQKALGENYTVAAAPMMSQIGSGAMPVEVLPSYGLVVSLASEQASQVSSNKAILQVERWLRGLERPVIGRLHQNALYLDLRCLSEGEQSLLADLWSQARL